VQFYCFGVFLKTGGLAPLMVKTLFARFKNERRS
jgi:hypothetical protein